MARYDVLVTGNNLKLGDDFLGISSVVLVEAGGRRLLVDAGGPTTRGSLRKALAARGLDGSEIDAVVLTHLHFDHVYNLDLFPRARVLVAAAEMAYAAQPHAADDFVPDWILPQLERRGHEVLTVGQVEAGVEVLAAPGHTPGLHALRLETGEGPVLLASDAIKYPKEIMMRASDLEFAPPGTATATIERLVDWPARIVPGHFPELHRVGDGPGWGWDGAAEFRLLVR
ncbi:MAG: MBL fold metallo-hydrolase [Pseudomonadota bacterium]